MCLPLKPFKVEREWEHAGLKCAVVMARENGHRCGYVRVPMGHPAHGKHYNDVNVNVHGGLTFGQLEPCEHEDGIGYWYGFDCAHSGDAAFDPANPPEWKVAFDAKWAEEHPEWARLAEAEHYWSQAEVEAETEQLADQFVMQRYIGESAK